MLDFSRGRGSIPIKDTPSLVAFDCYSPPNTAPSLCGDARFGLTVKWLVDAKLSCHLVASKGLAVEVGRLVTIMDRFRKDVIFVQGRGD